jgi:hypothetical protein
MEEQKENIVKAVSKEQRETDKMLKEILLHWGKESGHGAKKMFLVIFPLNEACEAGFKMRYKDDSGQLVSYLTPSKNPEKNKVIWPFHRVLGYNTAFNGEVMLKQPIVMPFLKDTLKQLSEDFSILWNDLSVFVSCNNDEAEKIGMYLFDGATPVKSISYEYIFPPEEEE